MIRTGWITKRFMNGKLLCLALCLALAGALMLPGTSFGAWVTDSFNPSVICNPDYVQECIHAVAIQADGKVIVGGYIQSPSNWLARFNADGTPDTAFNSNLAAIDEVVDAIAIQPNGMIVIGGHFTGSIMRLTTNGTVDATFTNPILNNLDGSGAVNVISLAVQSNGQILVGGNFKNVGVNNDLRPFFLRLNSNGSVDTGFNPNVSSAVRSIISLDSANQVLIGGNFYKMNCTYCTLPLGCIDSDGITPVDYGQCMSPGATLVSYVALLNMSDGSRVTSFLSNVAGDEVNAIARQSDGKILVGGGANMGYLVRLTSTGALDTTYYSYANADVNSLAIQPTDSLIAGGIFTMMGGSARNNIARLTSTGSLDLTFDPNANGPVYSVASSTDGTQVVIGGGFTQVGPTARTYVARIYNDGKTTTSTTINAPTATYGAASVSVIVSTPTGTLTGTGNGQVGLSLDSGPTTSITLPSNGMAVFSQTAATAAGTHTLLARYGGTSAYASSYSTGTLTVTQAPLTVAANSVTRPYLASNPTFTPTYTGFVYGQTSSVLTGAPSLTTTATSTSPVGTYVITAAQGTLFATNYSFNTFVDGVLTVTKAATTTSVTSNAPTTAYGNAVTFTATVTGSGATGSVTFNDNGAQIGTGALAPNGTATFTTTPYLLSGGTHTITAVYSGDGNFNTSTSSNLIQTITKLATTTTVASNSTSTTFGSPVTFTATVTSGATGTVTFKDGSTIIGTGTLSGGNATFTTNALGVTGSPHSVTATYSGDTNYASSSPSSPVSVTITQASTITTVASNLPSTTYGTSVTFTATVTSGATGTVTFNDNGTPIGTGTLSGGIATFTTSALGVLGSPHSITAVYSGDSNYAGSSSNPYTQTINQAISTTNIVSSSNPSAFGNAVSFTATVGAGATGTINFMDGLSLLGSITLSSGTATFTTSTLTVAGSPHSITAIYSGDTNYMGSTSGPVNQTILKTATTTGVVSSSTPTTYGSQVTFTATVSTAFTGTATGTVTFLDNGSQIGTGTLSGGGIATFSTNALAVGSHSITASYAGDANFSGSASTPALTETINQASTTAVVASNNNPSTFGTSVSFTATVTSAGGTPTGSVTFNNNGSPIGTGTLSGGIATFSTSTLGVAGSPHSITAVYNGDTNFSGTTSGAISQTVNKAATTTGVSPSTASTTYGTTVIFTATVTSSATGAVTFYDGVTPIGTGTLSGGVATFSTGTLGVVGSPHTITATYNGDANYNGSTSSSVLVSIAKAGTATGITSNIQISALGENVTFTTTVASTTSGIPTGSVQFYDGPSTLGSPQTLSNGVATLNTTVLGMGAHSITATYSGDTNFNNSTTATPQQQTVVAQTTTTNTILSAGTNPSNYGTLLTFSSTVTGTGGTPSGTMTFKDGATVLGTSPLISGVATFSTSSLGGGGHSITGTYSGDSYYGASTSAPLSQTVNKGTQTITFGALAAMTYGDAPFILNSSVTSGLTATYSSSNTSVAVISGNQVTIVGGGTATITAHQYGDGNYFAAPDVSQTLTVNKANQTVTFGALATKTFGDPSFALTGTASSTLPVNYTSSNTGVATVSGNIVTIVSAGTVTITAAQSGDSNYNAAQSVQQTLTINKANQTITFGALGTKLTGAADFSPGATTNSGLAITYDSSNTAVATIVGSNIQIVGAGTATITAHQAGNGNYNAAADIPQTLNVVIADGKFNGNLGSVDVTDALKALRIAAGIDAPTLNDLAHGDVAPLANGQRVPDGKIDLSDVVAILRKAAGLPSW